MPCKFCVKLAPAQHIVSNRLLIICFHESTEIFHGNIITLRSVVCSSVVASRGNQIKWSLGATVLLIRHQQAVLCCLVLYSLSHFIVEEPSILWIEKVPNVIYL